MVVLRCAGEAPAPGTAVGEAAAPTAGAEAVTPAPGAAITRGPGDAAAPAATVAFTLPAPDLLPEGIARDGRDGAFYLSSVRYRKVLRRDASGEWRDFVAAGVDGLLGTAGLTVDSGRDLLWAASVRVPQTLGAPAPGERSGLWAFRLADGTVAHRLLVPDDGPHLINDVTLTPDGRVFATDTAAGAVWEALPGEDRLSLFVASRAIASANGIAASLDGASLFVAHGKGIAVLPLDGSPGRQLGETLRGVDGLYARPDGLLAVQNQQGWNRIVRIRLGAAGLPDTIDVLVEDHPAFDLPTTCAPGDGEAWCIAGSHLLRPVAELPELEPTAVLHLPRELFAAPPAAGPG
jgi:sugar lactone lactonase YvrE